MYMKILATSVISLGLFVGAPLSSVAEEMPEGTIINAANLDSVIDMTFEGKRVGDMLPGKYEWMIRNHHLAIPVRHSEPVPMLSLIHI